ncbi:MAG TPA: hypothetical protein VFE78_18350, partial [Gemmataceae bacterium]|nr:hypothetical protein [Gemmataceae bacterium]
LANLQLKISGGANLLTASQTLTTSDHVTWVLGNLAGLTDPTHRLVTFTLALSSAGVTDAAGNALAGGASTSFVVLDPALALQGQTLTFTGTPGNDTFVYKAGGTAQVTLNGVSYLVDPTLASTASFVGNGGSDTVTLMAPAGGGNSLSLSPGGGTLSGPGYTVRLSAVSQVVAVGGPADRAYFTGSAGADVFVGTPTYAYLYGAGYFNQEDGFGVALAVGAGGSDRAYLYDGPGDDVFVGTPAYAYLYGSGFFNQANGFPVVIGYSTAGGTDRAYLYDSPGNDVFAGTPTYAYLYGSGFFNQANGFKVVSAYSTAGGSDTAYLYDSPGNDVFVATSAYSYLYGSGFFNQANGFAAVYAYSTGGSDAAYLMGTGTAADTFVDGGAYAYLYGNAFFALENGFGSLTVNPAAHR